MLLLGLYVALALGVSFLCSVAEAVLLSVSPAYVELQRRQGRASADWLKAMKADINQPLAAILTLNTIAHTVGAAGAGAQAAAVFGNDIVGIASAVLTLLILVFSEIIPKSLGAAYWRQLAPAVAGGLRVLIWVLYPFVKLSGWLTSGMGGHPAQRFSRHEFHAMAELGAREGAIEAREREIFVNLLRLRDLNVRHAMTPRTVMFRVGADLTVDEFLETHGDQPFSRIPLLRGEDDRSDQFVLRVDLLLARARGQGQRTLAEFGRPLLTVPDSISLLRAYDKLIGDRAHIALLVDEYGTVTGLLTLEDVIETLLGLEIVDEQDPEHTMQTLARSLWRERATRMGIPEEEPEG